MVGSEEVSLFDAVLCLLGEALHDKESWFLDEGFQSVLTQLAGGLLDGYVDLTTLKAETHCSDNEKTITITTQRERILLVELLHAE